MPLLGLVQVPPKSVWKTHLVWAASWNEHNLPLMLLEVVWLDAGVLLEPPEVLRIEHEALQASSMFACQQRRWNLAGGPSAQALVTY